MGQLNDFHSSDTEIGYGEVYIISFIALCLGDAK